MNKAWTLLAALTLLAVPPWARGAEQIKLKYVTTLYADAAQVGLRSPSGVSCTGDLLFVADSGNKRIVRYRYGDGAVTPDAVFPVPKMFPLMVEPSPGGDLYVLDGRNRRVSILGPDGAPKGNLEPKGMPDQEKVVPRSLRIDGEGRIYLLDLFGARVLVLAGDGTFQREVLLPKAYGFVSDVAVDGQGNLYVLDSVKAVVYRAQQGAGEFTPFTGSLKGNMNFPTSLVPAPQGGLILVDQYGSGLAVVGPDGSFAGRRLGMGWRDGQLHYPAQISIGPRGEVFVADKGNNRVQEFTVAE